MKVYIAQLNPTVGALAANAELIRRAYAEGVAAGADVVLTTELAVTGYPPRDLLDREIFINAALETRDALAAMTGETTLVFGCITRNASWCGKPLHNAAIVARNGKVILEQHKSLLPTYDVFDELRYFEPGRSVGVVDIAGVRAGIAICEDFWFDDEILGTKIYCRNPIDELARQGAEVILNISASPYNTGKRRSRYDLFSRIATRYDIPLVYVNQVGGNDELLFDGSSIVIDSKGRTIFCAPAFEEHSALVQLRGSPCESVLVLEHAEEIGRALILGLRDYIRKCGFNGVVIGLSGGIDSAVTAAIAVEALGAEHVTGIAMPSQFSSQGSIDDARALAENLGIAFHTVPIGPIYQPYETAFNELFGDTTFDLTNENAQARIRGNILMAWSNRTWSNRAWSNRTSSIRTRAMVLSTGNKSEIAVGYCTLYGDMAGGLALLGDVYKTMVYRMARWLNRDRAVIPESSITKPPSAELRPNQTDQDSLPPYNVLDGILKLYIEEWQEVDAIVAAGFDRALVQRVVTMVDTNEFKRRQAAPTLRVSNKAFGSGRQMPIAQRWRRE
ncbi:MAG TPA: NAD+ synthase [Thermoanaerobaculia bacterium]|jgi:NAD+ synthase (glutamine-hydrolysing)|nr:NAD+ synthase [Thermoanaerobaculia bacterium]